MTVEESIKKEISQGTIKGIRIMMKNSLLEDPTFSEFAVMEELTRDVDGLYDLHDKREFQPESAWDDDYMDREMVRVVGNFSHERIKHLKKVVEKLRPTAARKKQATPDEGRSETGQTPRGQGTQSQGNGEQGRKHQDERYGRTTTSRGTKIAAGAAGGGVFGGVIAGIAGGSVIIGAIAGAVVVGAAVAFVTKGE